LVSDEQEMFEDTNEKSESVNRRRTYNAVANRKEKQKTKGQTMNHKTSNGNSTIEQHEPY